MNVFVTVDIAWRFLAVNMNVESIELHAQQKSHFFCINCYLGAKHTKI